MKNMLVMAVLVIGFLCSPVQASKMDVGFLVCRKPSVLAEFMKTYVGKTAKQQVLAMMTAMAKGPCEYWPEGTEFHVWGGEKIDRDFLQIYKHGQRFDYWWAHSCTTHASFIGPVFCGWVNEYRKADWPAHTGFAKKYDDH